MIETNFLIQSVYEPTYLKDTLNLVITEDPNRIFCVDVSPPLSSSKLEQLHSVLTWDYALVTPGQVKEDLSIKLNYKKGDYLRMNKFLNEIVWTPESSAEDMYELFVTKYQEAVELFVPKMPPSNTDKKENPKWFNSEI